MSIYEDTMQEALVEEQRNANCSFLNKAEQFVPIKALGGVL
jgi:hypothetical protein